MARKVFFSFHYKPDVWRASQVRNMGILEGNAPVSDNDWESITEQGDQAIQDWISDQLKGRPCTIVLIGTNTAGRKWIDYEIEKSWEDGKGVLGIYVHNLKDQDGHKASKGKNPFDGFTIGEDSQKLSDVAKAYEPPYQTSSYVYNYIKENLETWVEEAITIRNEYE